MIPGATPRVRVRVINMIQGATPRVRVRVSNMIQGAASRESANVYNRSRAIRSMSVTIVEISIFETSNFFVRFMINLLECLVIYLLCNSCRS